MSPLRPRPSDEDAAKAWDQIMTIAEAHALIVQAYGGVATLAIPEEQRKVEGLRRTVLDAGCFELEPGMSTKLPESYTPPRPTPPSVHDLGDPAYMPPPEWRPPVKRRRGQR